MEQHERLWTKNFLLICLTNLMMFTSFYFLLPTLPIFVTNNLRGNESHVGYIIGIMSLTAVLVRPFSGYLLDNVGRKKVFLIALAVFTISLGAYNLVTSLVALFFLRFIHGLSWGFTTTGAGTAAADLVPSTRRGEGLGYYGLSNTLAMALGPSLGLYIMNKTDFNILFTSATALALLGFVFAAPIKYIQIQQREKTPLSIDSFLERRVFTLSGIMLFTAVVYGGIVSFITLYAKEININNAGIFFLVYALALMIIRPQAGKMFDKNGPKSIMAIGFGAIILSFILLYASRGEILFIISAFVLGIGFGMVQPTVIAMAINMVEPYRRGAANGTIFSAFDMGIGFGSILLGWLSKIFGMANMYLFCAMIVVIPAVLFFSWYSKTGKKLAAR